MVPYVDLLSQPKVRDDINSLPAADAAEAEFEVNVASIQANAATDLNLSPSLTDDESDSADIASFQRS